jgi:hypothetical protein
MTRRIRNVMPMVLLLVAGWSLPGEARVVRFVVEQKRPVAEGKSFGDAGPYERLDGTVYIEVDPRDPLNKVIVNLDKAPRTPQGLVGFSSPFFILKPVDPARGGRKIFCCSGWAMCTSTPGGRETSRQGTTGCSRTFRSRPKPTAVRLWRACASSTATPTDSLGRSRGAPRFAPTKPPTSTPRDRR